MKKKINFVILSTSLSLIYAHYLMNINNEYNKNKFNIEKPNCPITNYLKKFQ